ncbi:MAG: toxin-antitoxin system HicB family antitoxin [Dehalococcoidales bacterium]|jgi:antitoxin HicB|nr:toxin-antitoxin system HicB family antitoxin [Dehalococcoidales bacterium]
MVIKDTGIRKTVEYYMDLPYTMMVKYRPEQGGYHVAGYVELPDLTMTGSTPEEAVKELLAEKEEWFAMCLERGIPIPLPVESRNFSGRILLRTSPSLHKALYELAELEGVSLNQYIITRLARAVGKAEGAGSAMD